MVLLLFIILVAAAASAANIQQKHSNNNVTSSNFADSLRLRDLLDDERYAPLLKDLRSPLHRVHQRHKRSYGVEDLQFDMTTALPVAAARKNTKRTKNDKKTTKHAMTTIQTSTPSFQPSKASASSNGKVKPTVSPTKYHYYPHNQHMYYLPECAIQQVCNAVYVRLNYTQPLCACPPRYRDPCSASLNEDDNHTLKLIGNEQKKAITLAKTCETTTELRDCRPPRDWSILALQNTRTGKSHYLVICKCPPNYRLEGPLAHDQPTYAGLPGINVYGMLCVPPQSSTTQSFVSKWKENTRFPVSSYRSKNSTITAEERVDTDVGSNNNNEISRDEEQQQNDDTNSIESETARNSNTVVDETTITENYAMQDEEMVEDETEATDVQQDDTATDAEIESDNDDYFGTTEGYSYTTDAVTDDNNLTE